MRYLKTLAAISLLVGFIHAQSTLSTQSVLELILQNRYQAAAQLAKQLTTQEPNNAEAYFLLGQARQALKQFKQAAEAYRRAANLDPRQPAYRLNLARTYVQWGHYGEAVPILTGLLAEDSSLTAARILLARVYFEQGKYEAALQNYNLLLRKFPQNAFFYGQAGECALKLNRPKQAESFFHKVMQFNPGDLQAVVAFYNLLKKQERWDEALNVLNIGLTAHPKNNKLLIARGDAQLMLKKYMPARKDFSRALALGDSTAYLYKKLGVTFYYLNDFTAALFALQKSAEKDASDPVVFYFLGLTQQNLGMTKKAIRSFNRALNLVFPSYLPDLYLQLAQCYVAQDDYSKALEYYKEIMKIAPERKIVLFYMATLYEKYYKDLNVPLQYYQKFLDQADETVPRRYKTYALEHMKALKEKLHFQKGKRRKEK